MKAQRFTAILFIFIIGVLCLVSAPAVPRILTYRDTDFQGVLGDRGQGSRLDSGLSKEFPALTFWMGVYGEVNKTLGIRYIPDQEVGVAKLDGGQLSYGIDRLGDKRLDEYVENTAALKERLESRGVPLVYVQVPFKTGMEGGLEKGGADYSDYNCNRLISALTSNNVEVLDLRREMKGRMSPGKMFFRTDHHWRPEAALMAAGILGERIHSNLGLDYKESAFDSGSYNEKIYEKSYLGALGKKTGATYGGTDDFPLLTPRKSPEFRITWERDGKTFSKEGKFEEALVDRRLITKGDLYHRVSYDAYMNGRQVTAVDMRDFTEMSLWEYLKNNTFDCVVIAYNPASLEGRNFSFFSRK